eukprot:117098_1
MQKTDFIIYRVFLLLIQICLYGYIVFKLLKTQSTYQTPKTIKRCIEFYLILNLTCNIFSTIFNYHADAYWFQTYIHYYVVAIIYPFMNCILSYFLKTKLHNTFENTEFSSNEFILDVTIFIYLVFTVVGTFVIAFYPNLFTVIIVIILDVLYCIFVVTLFTRKLYHFLLTTRTNSNRLSTRNNNAVTNGITTQATIIWLIVLTKITYYWVNVASNTALTKCTQSVFQTVIPYIHFNLQMHCSGIWFSWFTIAAIYDCIIAVLMHLSLRSNLEYYKYWCKYCHTICLCICNQLVNRGQMDLHRTSTFNDNDIASRESHLFCNHENCSIVNKMCNVLLVESNDVTIQNVEISNDFEHLLMYHDDPTGFAKIYNKVHCNCSFTNCDRYLRNNRRRINIAMKDAHDFEDSAAGYCLLDKIHAYYCHSYDTHHRKQQESKVDNELSLLKPTQNTKMSKFTSNFDTNNVESKADTIDADMYSYGQRFEYDDKNDYWYVGAKYDHLTDELLNNRECKISIKEYSLELEKCDTFMKSNRVKVLQNRDLLNELSRDYILSLLIYCNSDEYQNIWSATFRRIPYDETDIALKCRHSQFYHSSKNLLNLIEIYGEPLIYDKNINKTFYHGVNTVMYFYRTITQFNGPLSTSRDILVAQRFSGGSGLILELKYHSSTYPLSAKYFECSFFSDYPMEKECLFIGGIPTLIVTNIVNLSNNNEAYRKYITGLNTINSVFNGTYQTGHISNTDIDDVCLLLLSNQLHNVKQNSISEYVSALINTYCVNLDQISEYVKTLMDTYCVNLDHITIFWDDVFGKSNRKNMSLQKLLTNYQENDRFFDLNTICTLFPNLYQIEYYKNSWSGQKSKVTNMIQNVASQKIISFKNIQNLKYIIYYHETEKNIFSTINTKYWKVHRGNGKLILHKETVFDVKTLNFRYYQRKQGYNSQNIAKGLQIDVSPTNIVEKYWE